MAEYIDDSGIYNKDALFVGVEDTAWSRDETNNLIWFSGTGTSTTGFTLPSATAWIVYEVYAVDSYTNDLTDGTNVYAWVEYSSTIGVIATTLETWKTAWESTATTRGYTTYKIKATHYKTGDVADVYYATEAATDFSKAVADGIDGGTFTGYGAWSLSDDLLADGVTEAASYGPELLSDPTMDGEIGDGTWSYNKSAPSYVTMVLNDGYATLYMEETYNCQLRHANVTTEAATYRIGCNVSVVTDGESGFDLYMDGYSSGTRLVPCTSTGWIYTELTVTGTTNGTVYFILPDDSGFAGGHYQITDVSVKKVL